ncbi:MAG: type I restriction endonuclease subunit R, partial [Bacteroidales bacterium]|nr:type I restriction endonuclease subunit R [Bacteroidales bacterium]
DAVMQKIKKINRANAVLRLKYRGDEKYVRIHKRVREENERRSTATPQQRPIISQSEQEIAAGLNAIKRAVDEQVYLDFGKMLNQGFFDQLVMSNLATQLHRLKVPAQRDDRAWLRSRIVSEYREGYRL